MILSFSKEKFIERIKSGTKIHTIREDKHLRWKVGRPIQFWYGNPRNVKNNPYQFGIGEVNRIDGIFINPFADIVTITPNEDNSVHAYSLCDKHSLLDIALDDGFDSWADMKTWFNEPFGGRLLYWTNFKTV